MSALAISIEAASGPGADTLAFPFAQALIDARRNVMPKRLDSPGPSLRQQHELFELAAAAPDHGCITPWRFVVVPAEERWRLADAFEAALLEREPDASPPCREAAREKAHRAPVLVAAVVRLAGSADIAPFDRIVSLGAAIQNILLGAQAMGFSSGLASGKAMQSAALAALMGIREGERLVCSICLGTATQQRPRAQQRPQPGKFVTVLGEQSTHWHM